MKRILLGAVLAAAMGTVAAQGTKPGVLRLGYTTGPSSLDPARATSGGDRVFLLQVYDRLIRLTNAAEPLPMLATKWEFVKNGTGLVLTLRQGVKFHDGTPFDAQAVKANLDRYRNMEGSTQRAVLSAVTDVQVLDANRVEIQCKNGCGGLTQTLGDNPGMMVSPKAFNNPDLGTKPIGAGPYTVSEYRAGARIVYAPVPGYHDASNQKLGGIEITVLPDDTTRLNALRSGQLDMTFLRPYQVDEAKAAKLNLVGNRGAIWYYMGMNMNRGKFSDVRVRRALNHAVDKRRITESLLKGYCTPSDQPFREGLLGYAKGTPKIMYEYDPGKAKKLLAEAGFANGFEFDALVWNIPLFVQIAEVMQAQFAQVGVKMTVQPAPVPQVMGTYFGKQAMDAFVGGNLGSSDPSATVANLYLPTGFFNPSKFSTPAIQEAYTRTVRNPDNAERQKGFEVLVKAALEQAYHVGLCDVLTPVAYTNAVLHVTPDVPTWTWDFYGIEVKR
ncbi:MAG: ABC transporter substrate-binding protein [Betaproteobacteria bacterium]